jgi:16S rRNA (cytosine967-C5)-methyltransferase
MWHMNRIPEYALVNDAVELSNKNLGKGIGGFVNGMLRNLARKHPWEEQDLLLKAPAWIQGSLPQWLWDRWALRFGNEGAMDFARSLNSHPQVAFRYRGASLEICKTGIVKSSLVPGAYIRTAEAEISQENAGGMARFQDEASQLIPYLFNPQLGWSVWDACAAPGGKAEILSRACGASGRVIAGDLKRERAQKMLQFLNKEGAENVDVLVADAAQPPPFIKKFDAVLVDVPCSGLGTLRRNPEIKWNFNPNDFADIQKMQKKILHHAANAVQIGGRLVYSTCSTEPEENEQVVQSFLSKHTGFSLIIPDFPSGIENWTHSDGMVRTFPSSCLWDGFFAALMVRHS